jgi:hypothetical protein
MIKIIGERIKDLFYFFRVVFDGKISDTEGIITI